MLAQNVPVGGLVEVVRKLRPLVKDLLGDHPKQAIVHTIEALGRVEEVLCCEFMSGSHWGRWMGCLLTYILQYESSNEESSSKKLWGFTY